MSNSRKKLAQMQNEIKSLRQKIKADVDALDNCKKSEQQKENEARQLTMSNGEIQKEIEKQAKETEKVLQNEKKVYKTMQIQCMKELNSVKKEIMKYTRLAEATAQELHQLELTISQEFMQLRKMDAQEKIELDAAEAELKSLENEEKKLLAMLCGQSLGNKKMDSYDINDSFEKQKNQLRALQAKLEETVYYPEPRNLNT